MIAHHTDGAMRRRLFPIIGIAAALVFQSLEVRAAETRLDALDLGLVRQGWGYAHTNESVAGHPLSIGGTPFARGIGTHAPSEFVLSLDGQATRFAARVGVNDAGRREPGTVEFIVSGDGKVLARSGVMRGGDPARPLQADLAGVRELRLVVTDGGDNHFSDHANWADAVVTHAGRPPAPRDPAEPPDQSALYPPAERRIRSPGHTTYFVNPAAGDDGNSGLAPDRAWKTVRPVNARMLAAGDRVDLAPGDLGGSLVPMGGGTEAEPVEIRFQPGRFVVRAADAIRLKLHISNGNDHPERPKPVALLVREARHVRFIGKGSTLLGDGTLLYFVHDRADDVSYAGLTFDLRRPTVSEFRVLEADDRSALIHVAEGCDFVIDGGRFRWVGDEAIGARLAQQAIPAEGRMWRTGAFDPFGPAVAADLGGGKVRLTYAQKNPGLAAGRQYCFRIAGRDCVGGFNERSSRLAWRDCNFRAFAGLGIVSQFCEDLTYERVNAAPAEGAIRTCPAWADMFHFSGCRGRIVVADCLMSGTQDDPINVHGTHLRLIEKPAPDRVLVRFMHPQTYGFAAFAPGDRIEFVNHRTLRAFATNAVRAIERKSDKDWLLTLEQPAADFAPNDVVENVSWCPDVEIRSCRVTMDATRGFLITTRGRVLVESNTFNRTTMSAIDIADDANSWFESGPVRDVTIRGNTFIQCGGPVIRIAPENHAAKPDEPVHENIRILDNVFQGGGIGAKSVRNLRVAGNRFSEKQLPLQTNACSEVVVENNRLGLE